MALKFCANLSFMFQETSSLLERYTLAKNAGFKAVECAFPYDYTIEEVVKAKNEADVEQVLINVYPGDFKKGDLGFAALPGKEKQFADSLKLAIDYAKALNCKKIHIMSGTVKLNTKENDEVFEKNLKSAVKLLEMAGITGLIEPLNPYSVPNYYLNDYEKGLNILNKINSPFLKLQLDIFHLQHLKGNITNCIKEMLSTIGHIQIAQVPNRNEPNTPGEINYKYIFSILEQHNYSDFIGLEYKPANDTIKGLKWIDDYGFQL